jgi:hypothetical protein
MVDSNILIYPGENMVYGAEIKHNGELGTSIMFVERGKDYGKELSDIADALEVYGAKAPNLNPYHHSVSLAREYDSWFKREGYFSDLSSWVKDKGMKEIKPAKVYGVTNAEHMDNAVAWTFPLSEDITLGINIDESEIEKFLRAYDVDRESVLELVLAHEYMHNAQEISQKDFEGSGNSKIEYEVELLLRSYFMDKSRKAASEGKDYDGNRYKKVADITLSRYAYFKIAYMQEEGEEVNYHTLKKAMLDDGIEEDVAEEVLEEMGYSADEGEGTGEEDGSKEENTEESDCDSNEEGESSEE